MLASLLLTVFAIILIFVLKFFLINVMNIPPGPWGVPFLGYYPMLGSNHLTTISKLADKYGEIMTINFFGINYYYLNSKEMVKQVLIKQGNYTVDRPDQFSITSPFGMGLKNKSFIIESGDSWRIQHSFFLSKMAALGLGKAPFEQKISISCEKLVDLFMKSNSKAVDACDFLTNFSANVVAEIMFSKTYEYDSPEFITLRNAFKEFFICIPGINGNLSGKLFSVLSRLNSDCSKRMNALMEKMTDLFVPFVLKLLIERQSSGQQYNDLLDFLSEQNIKNSEHFTLHTIAENCFVLFTAGTEVVSLTLYHALNLMILHPEVQEKVQQEIDTVVGSDCHFSYQERHRIPYTRAVIQEVQRFACVIPFGIVRSSSKPITVTSNDRIYVIPRKSSIIPNLWQLSRDPKEFKNPHNFDPRNFLTDNGEFMKNESNIPFSIGKRMCIGYSLAAVELFIAFVTLMQKFQWKSPSKDPPPRLIIEAQARVLHPFNCCAIPRYQT